MEKSAKEDRIPGGKRDVRTPSQKIEEVDKVLEKDKLEKEDGQTQYPSKIGHHGSDNETDLNPEE